PATSMPSRTGASGQRGRLSCRLPASRRSSSSRRWRLRTSGRTLIRWPRFRESRTCSGSPSIRHRFRQRPDLPGSCRSAGGLTGQGPPAILSVDHRLSTVRRMRHNRRMTDLCAITVDRADGTRTDLSEFRGRVLLIVNTASRCGFTPQYAGLEALWRTYRDRGLAVLAFPCNQFGGQEPGTAEEILDFCTSNYDVSFPVFGKVDVNGPGAAPLFQELKSQA